MNLIRLRRLVMVPLLALMSTAPALAEDWVVTKISGEAWIAAPNAAAVRATAGMAVPDGSTLSTRHNGRAQLERGAESILVSPDTVIAPQSTTFFGTSTTIQQQSGRIELEVEKRNVKHFTVKTPLLAAVVKGTRFAVSVSARRADVQVSRGVVEVSDLRNGSSVDIGAGQRATVSTQDARGPQVTTDPRNLPDIRKGRHVSEDDGSGKGQSGGGKGTGGATKGGGNGNTGQGGSAGAGGNGKGGGSSSDAGGGKGNSGGGKGDNGSGGSPGGNGSGGSGSNGKGGGNSGGGGNGKGGDASGSSGNGKGGGEGSGGNGNGGGNSGRGHGGKGKDR